MKKKTNINEALGHIIVDLYGDWRKLQAQGYKNSSNENNISNFKEGDEVENSNGKIGKVNTVFVSPDESNFYVYVTYRNQDKMQQVQVRYNKSDISEIKKLSGIQNLKEMKNNLLSEEKKRMQELAGIITESQSDKSQDVIEEGWKEWLIGGLLTLSSIGGFYKLNEKVKQDEKINAEYALVVNKVIDKMSNNDLRALGNQYNDIGRTQVGTDMEDNVNLPGTVYWSVTNQDASRTTSSDQSDYDRLKKDLKQKASENSDWFLIKKDGTTVTINPEEFN